MKIDRETYEQVFIAYLEGRLTDTQIKDLIIFLDENPDLQKELQDITSYAKEKQEVKPTFFVKDSLKKEPLLKEDASNFDELCIAFHENILSEKQENILLEMIENSSKLNKEFHLYGVLKYKPDLSIQYPNKQQLLKKQRKKLPVYFSYAASIILITSFVFYWSIQNTNTEISQKEIAVKPFSYKQLSVGFSKDTKEKYQAIVSQEKQVVNKKVMYSKKREKKYIDVSPKEKNLALLDDKKLEKRKAKPQEFKSYIAEFFKNIVGPDVYQQKQKKIENPKKSKYTSIQKFPLSDNTPSFHYRKIILGSESEN